MLCERPRSIAGGPFRFRSKSEPLVGLFRRNPGLFFVAIGFAFHVDEAFELGETHPGARAAWTELFRFFAKRRDAVAPRRLPHGGELTAIVGPFVPRFFRGRLAQRRLRP